MGFKLQTEISKEILIIANNLFYEILTILIISTVIIETSVRISFRDYNLTKCWFWNIRRQPQPLNESSIIDRLES